MAATRAKKSSNGTVQLNANVPADLKKTIQKMAVDQDLSMSDLVARILQGFVLQSARSGEKKSG